MTHSGQIWAWQYGVLTILLQQFAVFNYSSDFFYYWPLGVALVYGKRGSAGIWKTFLDWRTLLSCLRHWFWECDLTNSFLCISKTVGSGMSNWFINPGLMTHSHVAVWLNVSDSLLLSGPKKESSSFCRWKLKADRPHPWGNPHKSPWLLIHRQIPWFGKGHSLDKQTSGRTDSTKCIITLLR